jgi:CheY-like chemotaxis protein
MYFQAKCSSLAKVLLVDDNLIMLQMVAELLRQEGHELFPFSNGSAALAGLTTHAPELVITDLYFDKTRAHGLEVVQKARAVAAGGGDRHYRVWHDRDGGGGDEERRVRLPGEAIQGR